MLREQETALLEGEVSEIEQEHSALMARCRTAKDEFDRLVQETEDMSHEVRKSENDMKTAQWMLGEHRHNKVPRFASEKEMEEHRSALIEANRTFEAATAKAGEIWPRYEQLRMKRKQAHEEFTELVDEEGMLSARLGHKRRELQSLNRRPRLIPRSSRTSSSGTALAASPRGRMIRAGSMSAMPRRTPPALHGWCSATRGRPIRFDRFDEMGGDSFCVSFQEILAHGFHLGRLSRIPTMRQAMRWCFDTSAAVMVPERNLAPLSGPFFVSTYLVGIWRWPQCPLLAGVLLDGCALETRGRLAISRPHF